MPKKKKTRKQKILADSRHHAENVATPNQQIPTYSVESFAKNETPVSKTVTISQTTPHSISTSEYGYLSKDLFKTITVTGIIILAEIILRVITKGV